MLYSGFDYLNREETSAYKRRAKNLAPNVHVLDCKFDPHKSFNGKAIVRIYGDWMQNVELISYDTVVARIGYLSADEMKQFIDYEDCEDNTLVCLLLHKWDSSATTLRHVKEFLAQYGFGVYHSKHDIRDDCLVSDYADYPLVLVRP